MGVLKPSNGRFMSSACLLLLPAPASCHSWPHGLWSHFPAQRSRGASGSDFGACGWMVIKVVGSEQVYHAAAS